MEANPNNCKGCLLPPCTLHDYHPPTKDVQSTNSISPRILYDNNTGEDSSSKNKAELKGILLNEGKNKLITESQCGIERKVRSTSDSNHITQSDTPNASKHNTDVVYIEASTSKNEGNQLKTETDNESKTNKGSENDNNMENNQRKKTTKSNIDIANKNQSSSLNVSTQTSFESKETLPQPSVCVVRPSVRQGFAENNRNISQETVYTSFYRGTQRELPRIVRNPPLSIVGERFMMLSQNVDFIRTSTHHNQDFLQTDYITAPLTRQINEVSNQLYNFPNTPEENINQAQSEQMIPIMLTLNREQVATVQEDSGPNFESNHYIQNIGNPLIYNQNSLQEIQHPSNALEIVIRNPPLSTTVGSERWLSQNIQTNQRIEDTLREEYLSATMQLRTEIDQHLQNIHPSAAEVNSVSASDIDHAHFQGRDDGFFESSQVHMRMQQDHLDRGFQMHYHQPTSTNVSNTVNYYSRSPPDSSMELTYGSRINEFHMQDHNYSLRSSQQWPQERFVSNQLISIAAFPDYPFQSHNSISNHRADGFYQHYSSNEEIISDRYCPMAFNSPSQNYAQISSNSDSSLERYMSRVDGCLCQNCSRNANNFGSISNEGVFGCETPYNTEPLPIICEPNMCCCDHQNYS